MRLGTTPTITYTIPFQANTITKLSIVFMQGSEIIVEKVLTDATLSGTTISVNLSETETLEFSANITVFMQIRCGVGSQRLASQIMTTTMDAILKGGVLE